MTKTDMIIKSMGITAYLDMMEKAVQQKIKACDFLIDNCAMELAEIRKKKKKKFFTTEKIREKDLNMYATQMTELNKALETLKEMTQELNKILAENENKEDIEDGIFDGLFKLSKV